MYFIMVKKERTESQITIKIILTEKMHFVVILIPMDFFIAQFDGPNEKKKKAVIWGKEKNKKKKKF